MFCFAICDRFIVYYYPLHALYTQNHCPPMHRFSSLYLVFSVLGAFECACDVARKFMGGGYENAHMAFAIAFDKCFLADTQNAFVMQSSFHEVFWAFLWCLYYL